MATFTYRVNSVKLRQGEVHSAVKVCIAPPRQGQGRRREDAHIEALIYKVSVFGVYIRNTFQHGTGAMLRPGPDVMLERPGLREDAGRTRGEKDPFPILGTLYARRGLVRIGLKDSKSSVLCLGRCT